MTDSRRLGFTENRLKCDFTAAETQGPDKQISFAPIMLSEHLRIKPPQKDKETRKLRLVCRVLDFYSSLSLQGGPEEKENIQSHLPTPGDGGEKSIANSAFRAGE